MGDFNPCPCPQWWHMTAVCRVAQVTQTLPPHQPHELTGVPYLLGAAATSVTQGSPGSSSPVHALLRKEGPPSPGPLGTKLPGAVGVGDQSIRDEASVTESRQKREHSCC